MRALLLALVLLSVPLSGCLEGVIPGYGAAVEKNAELAGRLDETRRALEEAQRALAEQQAEARAWRDNASGLSNASGLLRAERDDAMGLLNLTREDLASRESMLAAARAELDAARSNVTTLAARLAEAEKVTRDNKTLQQLSQDLVAAQAELARTQARYDDALAGKFNSLIRVEDANVTWQFTDLRGDTHQWRYDIEEYREDVKRSRPMDSLYLTTKTGRTLRVPDPRPYVDAAPFAEVIGDLTNGRSEQEFVREVFHLKRQLIRYSFSLVDEKGYYKYPGETLVEGTGICGDTTILLASLLEAGRRHAGYTYDTSLWIVEWDIPLGRFVQDAESVNHGLLEVKFADGTTWYVETTSYDFQLHPEIHGWRFEIP